MEHVAGARPVLHGHHGDQYSNIGIVLDVIVAGKFGKRAGQLLCPDAEEIKPELAASGRRIVSQLAIPNQKQEKKSS